MLKINQVDITDFYFNNHYLSEYSSMVAGKEGFKNLTLSPNIRTTTQSIINKDGELPVVSKYDPRTFSVPITLKDNTKLRDLAGWLATKTEQDFYFKNDRIKVKAMVDGALDLEVYWNQGGLTDVKFICYDPYFYAIQDIQYVFNNNKFDRGFSQLNPLGLYNGLSITTVDRYTPATYELVNVDNTVSNLLNTTATYFLDGFITKNNNTISYSVQSLSDIEFWNDGNTESHPIYTITLNNNAVSDITLTINGVDMRIQNVKNYVTIDTEYMTVIGDLDTTDSNGNHIIMTNQNRLSSFLDDFEYLKAGTNTVSVVATYSNIDNIQIQCRSRWI